LLPATEKFVKVFDPNVQPVTPAELSNVTDWFEPQTSNDAKLSDDITVVANARSSVLFNIVLVT